MCVEWEGAYFVALAGQKITMWTRLASNSRDVPWLPECRDQRHVPPHPLVVQI